MACTAEGSRPERTTGTERAGGERPARGSAGGEPLRPLEEDSVAMRPAMKPRMSTPSQLAVTRSGFVTRRRQMKASAAKSASSTITSFTKA